MSWFKRDKSPPMPEQGTRNMRTEGLWEKCDGCRQIIWKKDLEDNLNVCPKCGRHFRIDARTRLAILLDGQEWNEEELNLVSTDPLEFVDLKSYKGRLKKAQAETGLGDAII